MTAPVTAREYGAAIFSPGLAEVLLIKKSEDNGWAFPFTQTTGSVANHIVAAASAVGQLLGLDIGDKISRTHWIEAEFPQTGALVRLYVALGIKPDPALQHCPSGAVAQWHPLRSILPPVNAILRADHGTGVGAAANAGEDEEGGSLSLEAGIAPFLAKLKALLNKHPEWRISQLDPNLTRLIQEALALPLNTSQQQQPQTTAQQQTQAQQQAPSGPQPHQQQQGAEPQAGLGEVDAAPTPQGSGGGVAAAAADLEVRQEQGPQGEVQANGGAAGKSEAGSPGGLPGEAPLGKPLAEGQEGPLDGAAAAGGAKAVAGQAAAATEGPDGGGGRAACADGAASSGASGDGGDGEGGGWRGPQPQEHLLEYCRLNLLPEPCYSLVVKKSARQPLMTASCILPHLGVQVTPDMHVPGGLHAACQAAALAAILWLEGALPPDGGEAVRVVPVGWPPLLSEARGEAWEATQAARRAEVADRRRELDADTAQREALLREMDKKRQRLVEEAAELERLMAALRGGGALPETDLSRLTASLGLGEGARGAAAEGPEAAPAKVPRGAKRGAAGADDAGGDLSGYDVTVGLRALKFRSGSDNCGTPGGGGGGRGAGGGGPAPGTKRPREDGQASGGQGGEAAAGGGVGGGGTPKNVVMELKELCDRRHWPQPQYSYKPGVGPGAAAVVKLPPAAGLAEVNSGPQSNRKRAKEAAAAAALAQLSALGLK